MNEEEIQRLSAIFTPQITWDSRRCLHHWDKDNTCDNCVEACPSGAITFDGQISFRPELCAGCGACLTLCPTGAFSGDDACETLRGVVQRLPATGAQLDLACLLHPSPARAGDGRDAVVRFNACLASLDLSCYAVLKATGAASVRVRDEFCQRCAMADAHSTIHQQVARANAILSLQDSPFVSCASDHVAGGDSITPVIEAGQRALTRRDLLGISALREAAGDEGESLFAGWERMPSGRRRLVEALSDCDLPEVMVEPLPAADLAAGERCTACGNCARTCPTGALVMEMDTGGNAFTLSFLAAACVDCDLCVDICLPEALLRRDLRDPARFISAEPVTLLHRPLQRCETCGRPFAGEGDKCFICARTRRNPFKK